MSDLPDPIVHFGGPDQPPRVLRDLLRARVDMIPAGGEIAWATYYFRDRDLAESLMRASDRGVNVTLRLEGSPRRKSVNASVLEMLRHHGLGGGLGVHRPVPALHPHLHSKIYFFSHPQPSVFVGSFNPSGDEPEDEAVIAEIGDQDRGHNLLVEVADPEFALALRDHVVAMFRPLARLRQNRPIEGRQAAAWLFPRLLPSVLERTSGASRIRGCISHLKNGPFTEWLKRERTGGTEIRLVVHDTGRRVPESVIENLAGAGVSIRRYSHPDGLPMHAKFVLADDAAWFGSLNYNPRSRWLNREVLVRSRHPEILRSLSERFEYLDRSARSSA